jgi:hypothetical protein
MVPKFDSLDLSDRVVEAKQNTFKGREEALVTETARGVLLVKCTRSE